jgi:hypothetical protein
MAEPFAKPAGRAKQQEIEPTLARAIDRRRQAEKVATT